MSLCVIPARGGSKRIPRKNIRTFAGRPMIAWSIAAARDSGVVDRILVSTDDTETAEVARGLGAEVLARPANLADDHATTLDVMRHAIGALEARGGCPERVCCLYATAPFARGDDIRAAHDLLDTADFAMPVTRFAFPIQRAVQLGRDGRLSMFDPAAFATRSQDLEEAFHDAGQFYWGRAAAWKTAETLFGPATAAIVLPRWRVQDIDTEEDWRQAELLFELLRRAADP